MKYRALFAISIILVIFSITELKLKNNSPQYYDYGQYKEINHEEIKNISENSEEMTTNDNVDVSRDPILSLKEGDKIRCRSMPRGGCNLEIYYPSGDFIDLREHIDNVDLSIKLSPHREYKYIIIPDYALILSSLTDSLIKIYESDAGFEFGRWSAYPSFYPTDRWIDDNTIAILQYPVGTALDASSSMPTTKEYYIYLSQLHR